MSVGDIATIVLAISAIGSLLYVSLQVRLTRQQTKGQFLLALDDQFQKSDAILLRLVNEPDFRPNGNDWLEVWKLMSVFERISIMVDDRILDAAIIDRLHGFKVVAIIANDEVYRRLQSTGAEWQDFIDLCYRLADHRKRTGAHSANEAFFERVRNLSKVSRELRDPWRI